MKDTTEPTSETRTVRLSVFGPLTDVLGPEGREMELSFPVDADRLRRELAERYPELDGRRYQIAVDERIVRGNEPISEAREIALLPPFAGG